MGDDERWAADRAYEAGEWGRAAELWLAVAAVREGERRGSAFMQAACSLALGGDVEGAFVALAHAVDVGMYDLELLETNDELGALRGNVRWAELHARAARRTSEWEWTLGDPDLRRELLELRCLDQAARRAVGNNLAAIDRRTAARMREIVRSGGWPGRTRVGRDGAHAAWLLVQHADHDLALQRECLALLERAVAEDEATASEHAYLADRVAVGEGRPQRYGTQFLDPHTPRPIEDEGLLDERRRAGRARAHGRLPAPHGEAGTVTGQMSITTSASGREQQMRRLPSAGASRGSGW